jgi:hypothetical protein
MHGTLLIARLTWLETRRRKIALAALICGLLFLAVFGTAMYFGFNIAEMEGAAGLEMRIAATILTVAGLYVVNFLVTAVAILLPIDSLSGEIGSGVIQTLASKPVDRARWGSCCSVPRRCCRSRLPAECGCRRSRTASSPSGSTVSRSSPDGSSRS